MKETLVLFALLAAGCSYTMDTRYVCDGMAESPRIIASVTLTGNEGEIKVLVRETVALPASGEASVREAEIESYVPWNPIEKIVALPAGVLAIALTPPALVVGLVGTATGSTFGDKNLPMLLLPYLTLCAGVAGIADFAWLLQPLPDLAWWSPSRPCDDLPLRRTGEERVSAIKGVGSASTPSRNRASQFASATARAS